MDWIGESSRTTIRLLSSPRAEESTTIVTGTPLVWATTVAMVLAKLQSISPATVVWMPTGPPEMGWRVTSRPASSKNPSSLAQ